MARVNNVKSILHFFYQLNGLNLDKPFEQEGGEYKKRFGFLYKSNKSKKADFWKKFWFKKQRKHPEQPLHVLFYIHGYLAENPWFASLSGYSMQRDIFEHKQHGVNLVFSLQWDSGYLYDDNRVLAYEKGKQFGNWILGVIGELQQNQNDVKISFLNHSMGNIIFSGVYNSFKNADNPIKINQLFLCAADLSTDVFEQELLDIHQHCRDVHVLFHTKDKTLRVANAFSPFPRLGIFGLSSKSTASNVHLLDVTEIAEDDNALGSRFSHHRYFYGSKNVRTYINKYLGN
ncbi:MAG: alpha/beta hydrolase [Saprospiraceae bacterium]